MEVVKGPTLMNFVRARGAVSPRATLELGLQLCSALSYAHALTVDGEWAGLVHRDIKPANVLLTPEGLAKISDFGIAQIPAWSREEGGRFQGTPAYASPEQLEGQPLDARSDIFALGAVLHFAATGRPLFNGKEVFDVYPQIQAVERDLLAGKGLSAVEEVIAGLGPIVQQCVRVRADDRYPDAADVARDLRHLFRAELGGASLSDLLLPWGSRDQAAMSLPAVPRPKALVSLTSESMPATNITPPPDPFVGREAELDAVGALLQSSRLITLRGPAGVGKTRLARELARRRLGGMRGGAWFVELIDSRSASEVLAAVADVLGVERGDDADLGSRIVRSLAGRGPSLVILDNCEHVLPALSVVEGWLAQARELKVLATSREPLRRRDEVVFDLGPLAGGEAVQLFQKRAGGAKGPVRALVERLDRMPLAIELAAGRARELGTQGLLLRASAQLDVLRKDGATLREAVEWSWNLLDSNEQSVLAQLSIFRGGFTLEAAEAVVRPPAGAPWVLDLVGALVEKSLIHQRPGPAGPRLGLYQSIRAFAEERLFESDERQAVELRHGDFFARYGSDEAVDVLDLRPGREMAATLPADRQNLREAYERAMARRDHSTAGRLALARMEAALRRGGYREVRRDTEGLLRLADEFSEGLRVRLLRGAGRIAFLDGDRARGLRLLEQALQVARRMDDRRLEGRLLCDSGELLLQTDQLDEARELLDRSLDLARAYGDRAGEGCSLAALASAYGESDLLDEALGAFEDSMRIHRSVGNRRAEGSLCIAVGNLLRRRGRLGPAEKYYRRALRLLSEADTPVALATALGNLASILFLQSRYPESEDLLRAALDTHRRVGGRQSVAIDLANLAEVLMAQGRHDEARGPIEEALPIAVETGPSGLEGWILGVQAELMVRDGAPASALRQLERAEQLMREGLRRRNELAKVLARKGKVQLMLDDLEGATESWREAVTIVDAEEAGPDSEIWKMTADLGAALREL